LNDAPGSGVNLGQAVLYKPGSTFTSFTAWYYGGNGYLTQMAAGCQAGELSIEASANEFVSASFSYEGTKYYFNPIEITASTDTIDWTDDDGTWAAAVENKIYRSPHELAQALEDAMNAASTETITVSYSNTTGKFTISATGTVLSLLWQSGANTAQTIGTKIGFVVSANDTGTAAGTGYTSDNAQTYAAPYTPSYDSADPIVAKDIDLMIGTQSQNVCVCATEVSVTVSKEMEDVDCICAETGVQEKIAVGREVILEATAIINKYDAQFFDQLLNNTTISAMLNIGTKESGNWVKGKCVNVYMKNAVVSSFAVEGDNFLTASIEVRGFIPSNSSTAGKDVYLNFI